MEMVAISVAVHSARFTTSSDFHMSLQPFSTANRLIWLRRPARLVESDVALIPKSTKADIDAAWDQMVAENPRLTDGPCWHVLGVGRDGHGGATIHVTRTTYRMGAVRSVGVATGFAGLGTKAIAHWQGRCLIGKRADSCATYPSHWEFAPGGAVEPGEDPIEGIVRELMEECAARPLLRPKPVALLFDQSAGNWEIIHDIQLESPPDSPPNWEYSNMQMMDGFQFPMPASPCSILMIEVARSLVGM